mgnify:CR=1 FL=1
MTKQINQEKNIFLDNIRSALNVGSIFRTADGAGVSKIYLGGYTPAPIDRFGRVQEEIKKTSLGASETVQWESVPENAAPALLARLKAEGFQIVAVEQDPRAISIYDFKASGKICYIFGNEINGVRLELLDIADEVIHIPMHGEKESLNVAVAVGIVLFQSR